MVNGNAYMSREYRFACTPSASFSTHFSYDKLIIAVGSTSSTHGIDGLQHCFQLKTVSDARMIRQRILGTSSLASPLSACSRAIFSQITLKQPHCLRPRLRSADGY